MSVDANLLHPLITPAVVPEVFPSPFSTGVCELALHAAESLQFRLAQHFHGPHDFDCDGGGKMMGVLVVQTTGNKLAYLSAFSGMLGKRWDCEGFVPPVFDPDQRQAFLDQGETTLAEITAAIKQFDENENYNVALQNVSTLQDMCSRELGEKKLYNRLRQQTRAEQRSVKNSDAVSEEALLAESREDKRKHRELKQAWQQKIAEGKAQLDTFKAPREALLSQRRELSRQLQLKVFDGYRIRSFSGETSSLQQLFGDKIPPGGAGDCAAVKLLVYCTRHQLKPLCLAEFWWGSSPASGVRHHGSFYPACRGKCGVILPFMLMGIPTQLATHETLPVFPADQPAVVYEDDSIIIINKPEGMLSVPGKISTDSVENRLRQNNPQTSNTTLLVHRLDQATSGLMIAAKNSASHKHLQLQFQQRTIEKTYCAILSASIDDEAGCIELPLRVDIDDRPRQLVCYQHGKAALTHYRVIAKKDSATRVEFKPVTGRTHQLRLHAAHHLGLNAAIVGDELYGTAADRLYLHAETIAFKHPVTGYRLEFTAPPPF